MRSTPLTLVATLMAAIVLLVACTSEPELPTEIPTDRTVFMDATRVPTVTSSATPFPPTATAVPTIAPTQSPTPTRSPEPEPTSTPTPSPDPDPTAVAIAEREAYCREHALPTATPEPDETPTPVPTSPPGIADDEVPEDWLTKMIEIEAWVRDHYGVEDYEIGDFSRRFIADDTWRQWRSDAVRDWAEDEDSTIYLWEQINRTLTLLSADSNYAEFTAQYQGDRYIGLYNPIKRAIFIRANLDEFDVSAELTYVHEYAHHVQNVKYDFVPWRECFEGDSDAFAAITALIEGDASNTEYAYIENVIGWDRIFAYFDSLEQEDENSNLDDEPVMTRYRDELNNFTYLVGTAFVLKIPIFSNCVSCQTAREKIDAAFQRPPFTTEQVYYERKYFEDEGRDDLRLPEDILGDEWELRHGSTIGRSDWVTLLAALADVEASAFQDELPGWRGDYGMLFENNEASALSLDVALWENTRFVERLAATFDEIDRLERVEVSQPIKLPRFDSLHVWNGDTGSIALGVQIEPVDRFQFMFMAIGPDVETATSAIVAARDNVTLFGEPALQADPDHR